MCDGHRPSFLAGIYVGVDLLGYKVFEYLAKVETAKEFSKMVTLIYVPTSRAIRVPVTLHLHQKLIFSFLLILPLRWVYANKNF